MDTITRGALGFLLFASILTLLGCETSGNNTTTNVSAGDLANQAFTFNNGTVFGVPNEAVTLTFGDFDNDGDGNANTGPFTMTSASGTATGTVTVASCNLAVATSTYNAATFPGLQPQQTVPLDPCQIDTMSGALHVQHATTGLSATSNVPTPAGGGVAFVLTTDFATGSYSVVDLATRQGTNDILLGGVHSDALARVFNGLVYVVNRLGADNIQIIDPQQGYTTINQQSVGNGSNPQDIAVVSATKAYVSRLGSDQLLIVNPTTLAQTGSIDLSDRTKLNDLDGVPELFRMLVHNGLVYLILQHLDFTAGFSPRKVAPGEVVVINPVTDLIVKVIVLQGTNPGTDLQYSAALNRILVSSIGDFLVNDGGIEAINPDTNAIDSGFVLQEAAIGGDITHFQIVSATKGYAVVVDATFANALVTFNPSTGQKLATLFGPSSIFLPHFAINNGNELYLAVTDLTTPTPGVRIFDTVQDLELTSAPLSVGQLPPVNIVFIE
jgi:hypothetical protein